VEGDGVRLNDFVLQAGSPTPTHFIITHFRVLRLLTMPIQLVGRQSCRRFGGACVDEEGKQDTNRCRQGYEDAGDMVLLTVRLPVYGAPECWTAPYTSTCMHQTTPSMHYA
jgi:hypothetical protein